MNIEQKIESMGLKRRMSDEQKPLVRNLKNREKFFNDLLEENRRRILAMGEEK